MTRAAWPGAEVPYPAEHESARMFHTIWFPARRPHGRGNFRQGKGSGGGFPECV